MPLLHGEAIAIGMICETYLSERLTTKNDFTNVRGYINSVYDNLDWGILSKVDAIINKLKSDKKNKGVDLLFALLSQEGEALYDVNVTTYQIRQCLADAQSAMR
jgi:3-dehydroquinate synthase